LTIGICYAKEDEWVHFAVCKRKWIYVKLNLVETAKKRGHNNFSSLGFLKRLSKKNFTYKERRPTSTYVLYYSKIAKEHFLVNLRKGKNFLIM
jgi:hypothetical protein